MKSAMVVIGAGFGDEGKGLAVDALAAPLGCDATVVRFCGGANAGHTVTTPGGRRHVFSHFGAGTFAGAATYLSRFFVANPILWRKEAAELGMLPQVFLDRGCMVTTPFDIMLNQFAEQARGETRHGSVGVGLNETVTRCNAVRDRQLFTTTPQDFRDLRKGRSLLLYLRDHYFPLRAFDLGLTLTDEQQALVHDDAVIENFLQATGEMLDTVVLVDRLPADRSERVIFEGSQGLLLDERSQFFPHVTRSRTGLTNVLPLAEEMEIDLLSVVYMSRPYMTRHGAGPFPTHDPKMHFSDETNCPNEWQGTMRFGDLDIDLIGAAIRSDLTAARRSGIRALDATIGVSCIDQVQHDRVWYVDQGKPYCAEWPEMVEDLANSIGANSDVLLSFGPTRDTVMAGSPLHARPLRGGRPATFKMMAEDAAA